VPNAEKLVSMQTETEHTMAHQNITRLPDAWHSLDITLDLHSLVTKTGFPAD